MSGINVFITRDLPEIGAEMLRQEGFKVKTWAMVRPMTKEELVEEAMRCDALLCTSLDSIDADFLHTCRHLRIISQFAAGYDNIDLATAAQLGILIGNAPDAMTEATADVAFGLMIATSRKMFYMHKTIQAGRWGYFIPKANLGLELKGKTLGVFGLGRIGFAMAQRCKGAYNMPVIYHNRTTHKLAEEQLEAQRVSWHDLLTRSDILSVHAALTPETKGVFNADAFRLMKPTALFVNTSRGGLHNEPDLIEALNDGIIWGAGLDVTNPEPMSMDNPLLNMENVAVLPHIGSSTLEARNAMAAAAAQNIIGFFKNGVIPYRVVEGRG